MLLSIDIFGLMSAVYKIVKEMKEARDWFGFIIRKEPQLLKTNVCIFLACGTQLRFLHRLLRPSLQIYVDYHINIIYMVIAKPSS